MANYVYIVDSYIVKFNYSDPFYSYSRQHWFVSTGCNEYEYNVCIKLILFEIYLIHAPTHSNKWKKLFIILINDSNQLVYSLSCFIYKKKKEKHRHKAKQLHNLLLSIVVFVHESYLFCDSYKCWVKESRKQQHHACC